VERLLEHLRSPQLVDTEGNATAPARVSFVVAPGKPRWLGYAFFLGASALSAVLAFGLIDVGGDMGGDLVSIIGVVGMIGAVYGAFEVWRGRPISIRDAIERVRRR